MNFLELKTVFGGKVRLNLNHIIYIQNDLHEEDVVNVFLSDRGQVSFNGESKKLLEKIISWHSTEGK